MLTCFFLLSDFFIRRLKDNVALSVLLLYYVYITTTITIFTIRILLGTCTVNLSTWYRCTRRRGRWLLLAILLLVLPFRLASSAVNSTGAYRQQFGFTHSGTFLHGHHWRWLLWWWSLYILLIAAKTLPLNFSSRKNSLIPKYSNNFQKKSSLCILFVKANVLRDDDEKRDKTTGTGC